MGGPGGGFADRHHTDHAAPAEPAPAPAFAPEEITPTDPTQDAIVDDASLGGGPPDAAYAAFAHYTDGAHASVAARPAPTAKRRSAPKPAAKPEKQRADWQKVVDTTDGKPGSYDIGWMKDVDPRVLKSIDGTYSNDAFVAQATTAIAKDPELAKIKRERKKAIADIRKANKTTPKKGAKEAPLDVVADAVDVAYDLRQQTREREIRAKLEATARKSAANQTVSVPEQGDVRRADMQTLKRINYVSDVNTLSNDPEKTREHLESMRSAKGTDTRAKKGGGVERNPHAMMLSGDTADRFDMARDTFADAHSGFSIPTTSVGFGTRGLHETRQGLGYLGHMLGTTFDLFATENPNLKGPEGELAGVNDYMLKTLARSADPTAPARTRMDYIPDEQIMAMGQRTAAKANNGDDASMETQIREQYRETSRTSKNVKNAVDRDDKQLLHETQSKYFQLQEDRKREAELAAKLKKSPDDEALAADLETLRQGNARTDVEIGDVLRGTFGGQQAMIQDDLAAAPERHKKDAKHDEKWKQQELAVMHAAHDKLVDPARVFGSYHKDKKSGALIANDREAENVSLLQYLDRGFVRDDGTDYAARKKEGKQGAVFNEDVVAGLMKHGFQSGSYFGDTMHFDFVESQTNLVPGGRNRINMSKDRASPENTLPDVVNVPSTPAVAPTMTNPYPSLQLPPRVPSIMDESPHPLAWPKTMLDD